ncbi:class I SAM-dependent methyltransferase [Priestia taiwanensis]|uniref:Methyltransferase type 12 domain-containing protein n=1 Tax=Priestia taiwanensis TaxID=1347902 RepID=A0A917EM48_9BACI|nr:class I SAM-dependent methyltransferase [Priestia taiwanensis]MBM7362220.1 tRNA (cmo5U34)-methyltransferase [Priestia taiwanensis]GGE60424.1 hypothetical protein GCM10007140_08410 [Priestia taiwanensis]
MSNKNWNDKTVHTYEQEIGKKIPGYHVLFDLLGNMYSTIKKQSPELLIIGAGGGQDIITLSKKDREIRFTGVDPSLDMLRLAEFRLQQEQIENEIELIHGTIAALSPAKQFDGAICMLVLHFIQSIDNKKELLQRIYGQLKPGSTFFLSTIYRLEDTAEMAIFMQGWKDYMLQHGISLEQWNRFEKAIGTEFHLITEQELLELFETCGFKEVRSFFSNLLVKGYMMKK